MNDVIMGYLKKYAASNKSSVFALRDWINRNMKSFSLTEALECVYLFTGGHTDEMSKVIQQLTEKRKVFGRTQVYSGSNVSQIDMVRGANGKLQITGYNPDKEPIAKGQHMPRNQKIFRKSDDQVSKTYQNSEKKMMDFGQQVRKLYPNETNMYITHAMQAIKKYANLRKIGTDKVVAALQRGRLKLKDDEYNSFEIVSSFNESKIIVISENMVRQLNEELEMTEYKFNNNIRKFLSDLLADPVNAKPGFLLMRNGLTRSRLIRLMLSIGMIERDEKISDTDENGQPKTATMMVKFKIPKKNFNRKLRKLWIRLFERNLPEKKHNMEINEEGEGATSSDASGQFLQPLFPIQRRQMPIEVEEATATTNVGNYEYDVPFGGDKETLARKNGVGGSVSINRI
jgi:hypothetical protein